MNRIRGEKDGTGIETAHRPITIITNNVPSSGAFNVQITFCSNKF